MLFGSFIELLIILRTETAEWSATRRLAVETLSGSATLDPEPGGVIHHNAPLWKLHCFAVLKSDFERSIKNCLDLNNFEFGKSRIRAELLRNDLVKIAYMHWQHNKRQFMFRSKFRTSGPQVGVQ